MKKDSYFCRPKFEKMSGPFAILLSELKEGRHTVDFEIGKEFFEKFEESEVKEGSLIANIEIDKISSHLNLLIRISGSVRVSCDRCLEMFSQPVNCENRLLVKFGKRIEVSDPDILTVPADENELDLQQHIYEFIHLALPIKRVHPDDKNGKSTCDPEMLRKLEELIIEEENENDPRWDELKKLMNNN
ncbi:MAG: DUF177 domain-containing protein [Bacteroidetes bacterium]|nr:MAG: DUF177 domain-containing protein [Bacteroidota bacterium]